MSTIHHATAKKAAKLGLELIPVDGGIAAHVINGGMLATAATAKEALAAAEAVLNDSTPDNDEPEDDAGDAESGIENADEVDVEDENGEDGFEPVERSIVKKKYRKRYQPLNRTCGDEMAALISNHIKEDGILVLDRLIRFAKANDCWIDSYLGLNPGQIRMNVGNRLRAKVKKGWDIVWAD